MMSDEVYERIVNFLNVIAKDSNWDIEEIRVEGEWVKNEYLWVKETYDPKYVAQSLLDEMHYD